MKCNDLRTNRSTILYIYICVYYGYNLCYYLWSLIAVLLVMSLTNLDAYNTKTIELNATDLVLSKIKLGFQKDIKVRTD